MLIGVIFWKILILDPEQIYKISYIFFLEHFIDNKILMSADKVKVWILIFLLLFTRVLKSNSSVIAIDESKLEFLAK